MTVTGTPGKPMPAGAEASAAPAGEQRRSSRPVPTLEFLLWAVVLLVAAGLRLTGLGQTPLSQAEGARALESWSAAQGRALDAWPGGFVDALTALLFRLFGADDVLARLVPALAGLALVASLWLLRPHLGRVAVLTAAILAAISPVFVYDSRAADGQALGAAFAVCLCAAVLGFLEAPRPRLLIVACVLLGFGLATDAVFLDGVLVIGLWLALRQLSRRGSDLREARSVLGRTEAWLFSALPLTLAGVLLAVSRFGTGFARLRPAASASWALAFRPVRPGVPWHYALDVLLGYALPLTILGAVGVYLLLRDRSWRDRPLYGLLLVWLAGGGLLNLFMAGREPGTLLLTFVPLALLAGLALERLLRVVARWHADAIDLLMGAGLLVSAIYLVIVGSALVTTHTASGWQFWAGVLLALICLGAAAVRWQQEGPATAAPVLVALALIAVLFDLHGAGSVRAAGDEFLAGQHTTSEGKVFSRLLVANGGGVDNVDAAALAPLAWYLRETVASGGHGGARLIPGSAQVPSGYAQSGQAASVSRSWSPTSWSGSGMVRWWVYRTAWGRRADVVVKLVLEGE